jgi:hypothetical protein
MKKLLALLVIGGAAYAAYQHLQANRDEQDLWTEATSAPDLR